MAKKTNGKPVRLPWRDSEVFGCPRERCGYAHERLDRVEQHIRSGKHHVPRSGPEPGADAVAAPGARGSSEPGGEE